MNTTADLDNLSVFPITGLQPSKLGSLEAYTQSVQKIPLLTQEEERTLALQYRENNCLEAAHRLVLSHLRFVISIARNYLGYGLPHADLVQEGSIGLMKAVKHFDPTQGVRLVSYAVHWIKAEIHEYVLKNWRIVKIATTKAQRKLFFKLRGYKKNANALNTQERETVANELQVRHTDIIEMEQRLAGADIALEKQDDDDAELSSAPITYLTHTKDEPTTQLQNKYKDYLQGPCLEAALSALDERSRRIIQARWLDDAEDETGGSTLHELAAEFGVSAERIRQIQTTALLKMKKTLAAQYHADK